MIRRPVLSDPWRYIHASDSPRGFRARLGYTMADYLREARDPDSLVIVQETEGEIAGVVWVQVDGSVLTVHHLETDKDHEGQGVGTLLLRVVEKKIAPANSADEVRLNALDDNELIEWYERRGYSKNGPKHAEGTYGKVQPMIKKLA